MAHHVRKLLGLLSLAVLGVVPAAVPAGPASAAADGVDVVAAINGREVSGAGANDPIVLGDRRNALVRAEITNTTSAPLRLRRVRLDATALGVTFLAYDTVVPTTVPARSTKVLTFALPVDDITSQAVGLLPASVSLYDVDGSKVASQGFTLDVQGSAWSLFGTFGILIGLFTAASIAVNLWLVARRRLPPRRFLRGLRFAVSGAGLGLTFCFTLAAFRVVPPYPTLWPVLVAVPTLAAFALGVVSPGPLALDEDQIDVALREYRMSLAEA